MIRLAYIEGVGFDLVNSYGLQLDAKLDTAVGISLFTDARATDDELRFFGIPKQSNRGWWGDSYPDVEGDFVGSKLWLLNRSKKTDETLAFALEFTQQALKWIRDDDVSLRIDCNAIWYGDGRLAVGTEIYRPETPKPRWRRLWDAIEGEILEAE